MNISKTFPAKLGDVTDCKGLPFDLEEESYEIRIKKLFKRIFNMTGKTELNEETWNILKNMVFNPNKLFGIVEIDGFIADFVGKDDIALTFNMGIPRLRGRHINYLDRIYLRLPTNGDIKFYNSGIEDDEIYWHKDYKVPAWHPHIQNAQPCLGSYGTELAKLKSEGNPIAYLQTIHMFLNTWNRRSPFWILNSTTIDYHIGDKEFKASKLYNAFHTKGSSYSKDRQDFVLQNINKVNTGSIQNDAEILVGILGRLELVKDNLGSNLRDKMDMEEYLYIQKIAQENQDRRRNDRGVSNSSYTIIHNSSRHSVIIPIRYVDAKNESKSTTDLTKIRTSKLVNDLDYKYKKDILKSLNYILEYIYSYLNKGKIYDFVLDKPDYSIRLHCQYYNSLIVKRNELYDEMTATNSYGERITHNSNEVADTIPQRRDRKIKHNLRKLTSNRYRRINKMILKHYDNEFTNDLVSKAIATKLKKAFEYEIVEMQTYDGRPMKQLQTRGEFWTNLSMYEVDERFDNILSLLDNKFPQNLTELITLYENIKSNLMQCESNHLISEYTRIIRSLKNYGDQINNPEESTQQVHLSFE